jgi:prepilin-type N-terminal cleavage/methylation domain-containing protein
MSNQVETMAGDGKTHARTRRMLRDERGFTMIELVIGIAVLAVLGGVAMAGYGGLRRDAAERAMVNDLNQVRPAMERHYSRHNQYPSSLVTTGGSATAMLFDPSPDVTLTISGTPTEFGYTINATHAKTSRRCTLTVSDSGTSKPTCTG